MMIKLDDQNKIEIQLDKVTVSHMLYVIQTSLFHEETRPLEPGWIH